MDERFVSLAALMRTPAIPATATADPTRAEPLLETQSKTVRHSTDVFEHAAVVQDLLLVRMAAHEAFERGKHSLLASLAQGVLGRELALAPADLEALVAAVVDASRELEPVSLVLSAFDAQRVRSPLRTRIDAALAPGDFIVEVRDGALESPLSFRLRAALERASLGEG